MRRTADILLIAMFAVMAVVFAVGTFSTNEKVSLSEKRSLAEMPKLRRKTIAEFPAKFEAYVNDHLFKRTELVEARNYGKYLALGASGSEDVVVGKRGWLYFVSDGSLSVDRHEKMFSPQELNHWHDVMRQRTNWLAQHGIKYLFVVAPDKPSVYPEYAPVALRRVNEQSRAQQLSEYLRRDPAISFDNLSTSLLANKEAGQLYHKTDTHWNPLGAYIGSKRIIELASQFNPSIASVPVAAANFVQRTWNDGDCADLMGIRKFLFEDAPSLANKLVHPVRPDLPTAVVIHDSFGTNLKPYLENNFSKVTWIHQDDMALDGLAVLRAKPDIVIQEAVERHVGQLPPAYVHTYSDWLVDTLKKNDASGRIVVLPNSDDVSLIRVQRYLKAGGVNIEPINFRAIHRQGDKVVYAEGAAVFPEWYLIKTGEQGRPFLDEQSKIDYDKYIAFLRTEKAYALVSRFSMLDGSELALFKRR